MLWDTFSYKISSSVISTGEITTNTQGHKQQMHALRGGKSAAEREFERLYKESFGLVYSYVRARMSRDADAEDVVAEAYMKAARSFSSFDPNRAKFSTWMVTIARNCMISHFRKERVTTALDDVPESVVATEGGQNAVDDRELALQLLATLDDDERALVLLKYREDMRNIDIAREMNMNPSTVSTVLARAIGKMRARAERS